MLESIPIAILIGCILGALAGLGIGGGTLLILWLTLVLGIEPKTAGMINLMFFITAAGSASIIRLRQKTIPWKEILPAILCGCGSAVIFTILGRWINTELIKKSFGALLILTGLREVFYRPVKAR